MTEPRVLPTGTVTFVFSDIEGSTRLVQEVGPAVFTEILERHNAILRDAFARHGATERGTQGDSFLVMFRDAPSALAAAAEAEVALAATDWPQDTRVRVRMGIHTGLGTLGGDDYVGLAVNRAARIAAAAHGGQVLISDATRALSREALPPGVSIRPLGEHRLKDMLQPEILHQLVIDGAPSHFPPIRTERVTLGNLPARLTSFIGREAELAELAALLDRNRLVTLTGVGGTGKTSLAVEFARSRAAGFEHGTWYAALDGVVDAALVPATIATSLDLMETLGVDAAQRLVDFFGDRHALLVLDNFEHLLPAAPLVNELLQRASGLQVLVTSRSPLRLGAEQEYPVAPLSVPGIAATRDNRAYSDAVRLFIERAGRVRPGYVPTAEEIPAIEEICRRLDGLPLGIELAASRLAILPPRAIAERLAGRLELPGAGPRDVPERQRSLERAIAWSHDLLDRAERRLLARLSVFAGGCRLEEAEAVCGPESDLGMDVLEGVSRLIDHSLVQPVPGPDGARFRLLETIRVFASQRLAASGEGAETARRHALAYADLAELGAPHFPAGDQRAWLDRLSADHDNLRAAVRWSIDEGEAETALRLGSSLWRFWQQDGHMTEAMEAISRILGMPATTATTRWRMRALEAQGGLHWWRGDPDLADVSYARQLELARELGDVQGTADATLNLAFTRFAIDPEGSEVQGLRDEATRLFRQVGDERSAARVDMTRTFSLIEAGKLREGREAMVAALKRFEELGDVFYIALASGALSSVSLALGDLPGALRLLIRCVTLQYAMGDMASTTLTIRSAAVVLLTAGLEREAATVAGRYDALCRRHGYRPPIDPVGWIMFGWSTERLARAVEPFVEERRRGAEMTTDEVIELVGLASQTLLERQAAIPRT